MFEAAKYFKSRKVKVWERPPPGRRWSNIIFGVEVSITQIWAEC